MKRFPFKCRLLASVVVAALSAGASHAYAAITYQDAEDPAGSADDVRVQARKTPLALPEATLAFSTPEDARAYWAMTVKVYAMTLPDARTVAKAFLRQYLGVDGDAYVVAHFASPQDWAQGKPDHTMPLTDALMEAFPGHDRHTRFATWADAVGSMNTGGRGSPSLLAAIETTRQCRSARQCFSSIGDFLWSRTGPGYIYNLFFARGNVLETVGEDVRPLDEAFGVFAVGKGFAAPSNLVLSRIVRLFEAEHLFSELPYVRKLRADMDAYWKTNGDDWPVIARYRFVRRAREARMTGKLSQEAYAQVMREGAPRVPLEGAITLAQLRDGARAAGGRAVRRLDINGYFATNVLRFIAADGSETLYIPGSAPTFVSVANEEALRRWVLDQTKDSRKLEALLSRFSRADSQDGTFWTGVKHGLENIAKGQWKADADAIDVADAVIAGDVFADMRVQAEARTRDDARVLVSTAWEGWRTTLNRTATLLSPLGYAPPLAIPIQVGTGVVGLGIGIDEGLLGRTSEARKRGLEHAVMAVVTNVALGAALASSGKGGGGGTTTNSIQPVHSGIIGYPIGLPRLPRTSPAIVENEPYLRLDPLPSRSPWAPRDLQAEVRRDGYVVLAVPENSADRVTAILDLKKNAINDLHSQLSDVETPTTTRNARGFLVSTDRALAFRVDSRSPMSLLENRGFGPSREFCDVDPMLDEIATIGSRSLRGNNLVFKRWPEASTNAHLEEFHQYVIWTHGRKVASVADNDMPWADKVLEEVHFPADISTSDIYIIDSTNQAYAKAISEIVESDYVATPYGVPLEAFNEYLAGRLDIHAPNRFSERRL